MSRQALTHWRPVLPAACLAFTFAASAQEPPTQERAPIETAPAAAPADPEVEQASAPADPEAIQLDAIEVTASKRLKAQRDIPGSVGAIRGEDLEKMRAQGLKDYLKLVPGVVFPDVGNDEGVPVIRGIATNLGAGILALGATAATTGVYLEEMPFADLFKPWSFPDLNPFDLERVEVLKGPQGTLFGSGALAGAVRYIVQKPQYGLWQGKAMASWLQSDEAGGVIPVYAGAANVPLFGDSAALRAVAVTRDDPGTYDMRAFDDNGAVLRDDPDADRSTQRSLRVLGDWNVTDEFKASAFWFEQQTHQDDYGMADQVHRRESSVAPFASPRDHDFSGGNLLLTYDLPWARVLVSGNRMVKYNYAAQHLEIAFDLERQNDNEYVAVSRDEVDGYTREVRVSSPEGGTGGLEWLVGVSQLHFGNDNFFYSYLGPDKPDPTAYGQLSAQDITEAQVVTLADQLATESALFGEVTGQLGKRFEVTVGGRKYETRLRADTLTCGAQITLLFQTQCYPESFDDTTTGLNPKFSVRYLHNRNVQAYVLATKGFQFGGLQINPPAPGFPESAQEAGYHFGPYKSSKLWNYEIGVRTEWLDRRLRFDATLFYLDWKDLQLTVGVPLSGTNLQFGVIANVARAHSEGIEMALEVLPFNGAKVVSSVAIIKAVTDVLFDEGNADGGVKPGSQLPGAPHFTWTTALAYERSVPYFSSWLLAPTLTYAYVGESTDAIRPTGRMGAYATADARLDLLNPSSRFQPELSIGINNITDERGITYAYGGNKATNGTPYSFTHFSQPRTVLLSVSFRY